MALSAAQQWALNEIERDLTVAEPRLASMFLVFAALAKDDPYPDSDRPGLARRLRHRVTMLIIAVTRGWPLRAAVTPCSPLGRPAWRQTWAAGSPREPRRTGLCPRGHELRSSDVHLGWVRCLCRRIETGAVGHHTISCAWCVNEGRPATVYRPDCRDRA